MSSIDGLKRKIESVEGIMNIASDEKDSGIINYSEYVCACKKIFAEMKTGKDLKDILGRSRYNKTLKTELRKMIPRLVEKLKEENLWESEK